MRYRAIVLTAGTLLLTVGAASAQVRTTVRAPTIFESSYFEPGLAYDRVQEFAAPVGISVSAGRFDVTLSSGYATLDVRPDTRFNRLAGMLDTEARVGINLIPGRLIAVITGRLPTGTKVDSAQAEVLAPIASDVIGFAIPTLGSGASLGGGFVGALQAGRFAVGFGATYAYPFTYQPYNDNALELVPGSEIRARLGLEGPIARNTYLRFAGVFALKGQDEYAGTLQAKLGQRYIGYAEVVQGIGRMQLTLYGFDVYRGAPSFENTSVGTAFLPKGNLLAAGFRHRIPVTRSLAVAPRVEWRISTQADTTAGSSLTKAGQSLRLGIDINQALSRGLTLGLYGSGFFGDIRPQGGFDIPVKGARGGIVLTVTP